MIFICAGKGRLYLQSPLSGVLQNVPEKVRIVPAMYMEPFFLL